MSIVAMKNKSRGYNTPISGKQYVGFALNGTLRNQGYIGQTSLSHKLIKTPFKGNYPVGHGGHLGKYVVNTIFSCSSCSNDPTVIKKSTMNNLGHIYSSLLYPTNKSCGCVNPVVSTESYIDGQDEYIQSIRTKTACDTDNTKIKTCNNTNCASYSKVLTSVSSGDYMNSLIYKKKCISGNL
jgi:hypothetical protein